MQHANHTLNLMIESIALMTLISYLLSVTLGQTQSRALRQWIMGAILGLSAALVQLFPIALGPDIFIDSRTQFVVAAGAFFGLRGALMAVGCAIAMRLGIGGIGTESGAVSIAVAGLCGLAWRLSVAPSIRDSLRGLILLGIAGPLHLIVPPFFMPPDWWAAFYSKVGIPLALSEMIGLVMFGALIRREYRLHRLNRMLRTQAMKDPLTGMANRRKCLSFFATLDTGQLENGIALVYLDADHFKSVNDTYGHDAGDAVLRQIARIITHHSPKDSCAARIGGEEFCILLLCDTLESAIRFAEHLRHAIAAHDFSIQAGSLNMTASIGLHHSHNLESFDERLNAADRALYQAKTDGRNRVVTWHEADPHASSAGLAARHTPRRTG